MKNRLFFFFLSIFIAGNLMAQTGGRIGQHTPINSWTTPSSRQASSREGTEITNRIMNSIGLKPNFEVIAANVDNAAAVVYGGRRYILFNPNFISQLTTATGTKWAAISVLAHEIGHHLDGHTVSSTGSQPALELEADEFSGFVLRKMGATLTEAQAAMKLMARQRASSTHPGQYDRLASIAKGWQHADEEGSGRNAVASTQVPGWPETNRQTVSTPGTRPTATRNIIGDVRFLADPRSTYLVTSAMNLVKLGEGNSLSVIGRIKSLNSNRYPYLIYDESNTQLLVDSRGNILTRRGKPVGILSTR
jgi:hypothetical protein